jgi:hypothetical protein
MQPGALLSWSAGVHALPTCPSRLPTGLQVQHCLIACTPSSQTLAAGPDAPLALERGLSATHMSHAYDFYKPSGLYPAVDGPLSVYCYLSTMDACLGRYAAKFEKQHGRPFNAETDTGGWVGAGAGRQAGKMPGLLLASWQHARMPTRHCLPFFPHPPFLLPRAALPCRPPCVPVPACACACRPRAVPRPL